MPVLILSSSFAFRNLPTFTMPIQVTLYSDRMLINNTQDHSAKFNTESEAIAFALNNNYNVVGHKLNSSALYYFERVTPEEVFKRLNRCGIRPDNLATWVITQ